MKRCPYCQASEAEIHAPNCDLRKAHLHSENSKVNHPGHYNSGKVEVIDAIEAWGLGFCLGNTVKYVARAGKKPGADELEDLEKARWYLDREIQRLRSK